VKGLGEGGAIAPPVTIANAIADALAPFDAEFSSTPIKPEQIVNLVRDANKILRPPSAIQGQLRETA
jgi:carbon-monoxide dehydrogenase large subunit